MSGIKPRAQHTQAGAPTEPIPGLAEVFKCVPRSLLAFSLREDGGGKIRVSTLDVFFFYFLLAIQSFPHSPNQQKGRLILPSMLSG